MQQYGVTMANIKDLYHDNGFYDTDRQCRAGSTEYQCIGFFQTDKSDGFAKDSDHNKPWNDHFPVRYRDSVDVFYGKQQYQPFNGQESISVGIAKVQSEGTVDVSIMSNR